MQWWRRLLPCPTDWLPAFLYIGVLLDYLVQHHSALYHWQTLLVLGSLVLLAALERWENWRYGEQSPLWMRQVTFSINVVLIEIVAQYSLEGIGSFLYMILPLKAWLAFGRNASHATALCVTVVYVTKTTLYAVVVGMPFEQLLSSCIMFVTAIVFVLIMAHLVASDRGERERVEQLLALVERSHHELEHSHQQLAAYAAQVADLATVAERNRLARDIHDSLGHYLTAIAIQLEKALAFEEKDRGEVQRSVQTSRRMAQEALTEVRRSVGLLRSQHTSFSLGTMLHDLATLHGELPKVQLSMAGDETAHPLAARLILYRAAQEGLTNIRKHAGANTVWLDLRFEPTHATLLVADDGIGFDLARYEALAWDHNVGFGIQGLRERLALIGGRLDIAQRQDGGTMLVVETPNPVATTQAQQARPTWNAH